MAENPSREKLVFLEAIEITLPDDRAAFLDRVCQDDASLRAKVEALLLTHDAAQPLLDDPEAIAPAVGLADAVEGPGTVIGPYKLLQKIGEGGMGTVYMAEQTEPVRRLVALKIIKPGMDSKLVIARFESERQALALMDHPNIAKVLDGGVVGSAARAGTEAPLDETGYVPGWLARPTGRPYFVMDLVKGIPITSYCDEQHLTAQERLALIQSVCQAVQHAHQKGIIHRDLKPSNILVAEYDDRPVVKIIDFGVAKAIGQKLTENTLFTEFGQVVGTLEYMSPEQAKLNALDVDTRSDIYSLGVLLYELLTGTTPLSRDRFRQAAFDEVLRLIREEEPPKPSTRLSDLARSQPLRRAATVVATPSAGPDQPAGPTSSLASVAALRKIEPAKLTKLVSGDLDWIVMKCLEKDRNRRYETANGLAMDLQRYLAGEPVLAAPPSATYRIRKFVRRNRGPVLAAGLLGVTVMLGLAGTLWQARRASVRAEAAEKARDQADAINEFVKKALVSSDPNEGGRQDMLVADAMMNALREIEAGAFKDDPETEATLRNTIGVILLGNGRTAEAEPLLESALKQRQRIFSGDHRYVMQSLNNLASVRDRLGRSAEAEPLAVQAVEMGRRLANGDDADVAYSLNLLAGLRQTLGRWAEAEPLLVESLEIYRHVFPDDHPDVASSLNNLAVVRAKLGRVSEAEALHVQALEMYRRLFAGDHPLTAATLHNLACVRQALNQAAESEPLYVQALDMRRRLFQGDHPDIANSLNGLAYVRQALNRLPEAESAYTEVLEMRQRLFTGNHPDVATSLNNVALSRMQLGRVAEAEPLFARALAMNQRIFTGDHPNVAQILDNLAQARYLLGRVPEAASLYAQALAMRQRFFQGDHPDIATSLNNLAAVQTKLGRLAEAESLSVQALEMYRRLIKGDHPLVATTLNNLAKIRRTMGRAAEAEPLYVEALAMFQRLGSEQPKITATMYNLAVCLDALGRGDEAIARRHEALALDRRLLPPDSPALASSMASFGVGLVKAGTPRAGSEAEPVLRECLSIRQRSLPIEHPEHWLVPHTMSLLGAALVAETGDETISVPTRQAKFREAESLLLDAYARLKDDPRVPVPVGGEDHKQDAINRIIKLYEAWNECEPGKGNDAKAQEWRARGRIVTTDPVSVVH